MWRKLVAESGKDARNTGEGESNKGAFLLSPHLFFFGSSRLYNFYIFARTEDVMKYNPSTSGLVAAYLLYWLASEILTTGLADKVPRRRYYVVNRADFLKEVFLRKLTSICLIQV